MKISGSFAARAIEEAEIRKVMKESQEAIKAGHSAEKKGQKREDFVIKRLIQNKEKTTALAELDQEG